MNQQVNAEKGAPGGQRKRSPLDSVGQAQSHKTPLTRDPPRPPEGNLLHSTTHLPMRQAETFHYDPGHPPRSNYIHCRWDSSFTHNPGLVNFDKLVTLTSLCRPVLARVVSRPIKTHLIKQTYNNPPYNLHPATRKPQSASTESVLPKAAVHCIDIKTWDIGISLVILFVLLLFVRVCQNPFPVPRL